MAGRGRAHRRPRGRGLQVLRTRSHRKPADHVSRMVFGSSPSRAATMWTGTPAVSANVAAVWRSTWRLPVAIPAALPRSLNPSVRCCGWIGPPGRPPRRDPGRRRPGRRSPAELEQRPAAIPDELQQVHDRERTAPEADATTLAEWGLEDHKGRGQSRRCRPSRSSGRSSSRARRRSPSPRQGARGERSMATDPASRAARTRPL
jgi:hypothetical protein